MPAVRRCLGSASSDGDVVAVRFEELEANTGSAELADDATALFVKWSDQTCLGRRNP